MIISNLRLGVSIERLALRKPFRITGFTWEYVEVLVVTLEKEGQTGRGEAAGVYYLRDLPETMIRQVERLRPTIQAKISRENLQELLPPGGARNALDCALWDLEAKLTGCPAWQIARLDQPKHLVTTFTCSADSPEKMAATARAYQNPRAIKLKLTGEPIDADRVRAVRESLPEVWLGVDANQGFTPSALEWILPTLIGSRVQLIEQPFAIGQEAMLDGFQSPIQIAADESVQILRDLPALVGRFQVINIKLDKCGGLTEGVAMARRAKELGLETMVGNMIGTSLAMAPAFLIGQLCKIVDLDGPLFIRTDRPICAKYDDGFISLPIGLWG